MSPSLSGSLLRLDQSGCRKKGRVVLRNTWLTYYNQLFPYKKLLQGETDLEQTNQLSPCEWELLISILVSVLWTGQLFSTLCKQPLALPVCWPGFPFDSLTRLSVKLRLTYVDFTTTYVSNNTSHRPIIFIFVLNKFIHFEENHPEEEGSSWS